MAGSLKLVELDNPHLKECVDEAVDSLLVEWLKCMLHFEAVVVLEEADNLYWGPQLRISGED